MRIESIEIDGVRCFRSFSLFLDEHMTTLVGENGAGKSSAGLALANLTRQTKTDDDQFQVSDLRGDAGPLSIDATIRLEQAELNQLAIAPLLLGIDAGQREVSARR